MINTLCLKQDQIERAIMSLDKSEEIVKLTDYGHHRLRTEMYLGSRNSHEQIVINWDGKKLVPQEIPSLRQLKHHFYKFHKK